jgi:hypothetical protein
MQAANERHTAIMLGLLLLVVSLTFLLAQVFLFGGECRATGDCPERKTCMEWTFETRRWWAPWTRYRTCEIACSREEDCPTGYLCVTSDHGPGPGTYCYRPAHAR